jgi:hypothetical protein
MYTARRSSTITGITHTHTHTHTQPVRHTTLVLFSLSLLCLLPTTLNMSHPPASGWNSYDYEHSQEASLDNFNTSEPMHHNTSLSNMNQFGAPGQSFSNTPAFSENTLWGSNESVSYQETLRPRLPALYNAMSTQAHDPFILNRTFQSTCAARQPGMSMTYFNSTRLISCRLWPCLIRTTV